MLYLNQWTMCGSELFINMVANVQTIVLKVKYVDATTFIETSAKGEQSELQQIVDKIKKWSKKNHLYINIFLKRKNVWSEKLNAETKKKLLGVVITDSLNFDAHEKYLVEKISKQLFFTVVN